jgi:DNA-binding PadR family transcriptional regulator
MEKELLLLGILRREDMHGYQLAEFIEHNLGVCTDLTKSTAYYLLDKMAQDGWITFAETQPGKRPARRVYHLTQEGESAFQHLLRQNLAAFNPQVFPDDIGLAFLDGVGMEEACALLDQRRAALVARLEELRQVHTHPGTLQWLIDHQRHHLAQELNWLDEIILRIRSHY